MSRGVSEQFALRLSPVVHRRAEALIEFLAARQGIASTKTDVLREAIVRGLRELELDQARESR